MRLKRLIMPPTIHRRWSIIVIFPFLLLGCASRNDRDLDLLLTDCLRTANDTGAMALAALCGTASIASGVSFFAQELATGSKSNLENPNSRPIETLRCQNFSVWTEGTAEPEIALLNEEFRLGKYCPALRGFDRLAKSGNADAQRSLGLMYEHGYGVEVDPAKAAELYRQAEGR
jgi:TPR repeat protein